MNESSFEGLQDLLDDKFPGMVEDRLDDILEKYEDYILFWLRKKGYVIRRVKE